MSEYVGWTELQASIEKRNAVIALLVPVAAMYFSESPLVALAAGLFTIYVLGIY